MITPASAFILIAPAPAPEQKLVEVHFEVEHERKRYAAKEVHSVVLEFAQGKGLENIKEKFLHECRISVEPASTFTSCPIQRSATPYNLV